MQPLEGRFVGCLLGLACGDAVGTTVEFRPRGSFEPLTDMVGGGPFNLEPGEWTDDTSMALCLAVSLLESGGFDARDQMERYDRWQREGYLSSNGTCFDIGNTVAAALRRYRRTGEPFSGSTDPYSAGNGSLMRLAPIPMYYVEEPERALQLAAESSRTTHGAREAVDACRLFAQMLVRALRGAEKESLLFESAPEVEPAPAIAAIARGEYRKKGREEIQGSGYVVRSLEAALWCFLRTRSYREAILCAANLGDDADTTAAICGQIAGAHYGVEGIPAAWRERVAMGPFLEKIARRLYQERAGGAEG